MYIRAEFLHVDLVLGAVVCVCMRARMWNCGQCDWTAPPNIRTMPRYVNNQSPFLHYIFGASMHFGKYFLRPINLCMHAKIHQLCCGSWSAWDHHLESEHAKQWPSREYIFLVLCRSFIRCMKKLISAIAHISYISNVQSILYACRISIICQCRLLFCQSSIDRWLDNTFFR